MKLDATDLRYITSDEFRVLTAVEMGSKNHEVVPTTLIAQISGLRSGGVNKHIGELAKRNLIAKVQNAKYDGYRLTYGGYDYLAMRALSKRDSMYSVGNQIGVGKESDIYIVANAEGKEMVLKLHRLGRISFRAIKEKRDYLGKRKSASWMYMSRLAAQKEWAFMKILHEHGFPVPTPVDQARHTILMEFIDAYPLRQVDEIESPGKLYSSLMDLIVRFARAGLIHGDFNEFNILIKRETGEPVVIDFPQMVSTSHENAEWYFNRDVECIRTFFRRRFRYESALYPRFKNTMREAGETQDPNDEGFRLDVVVAASGFKKKDQKALEDYMNAVQKQEKGDTDGIADSSEEEEEEEEEESDSQEIEEEEEEEEKKENLTDEESKQEQSSESEEDLAASHDESPSTPPPRSRAPSPSASDIERRMASLALSPSRTIADPFSVPGLQKLSIGSDEEEEDEEEDSEDASDPNAMDVVKDRVATEIQKRHARQHRKFHSKKSTTRAGRPKGSKAKQDTRVKLDGGGWY